MMISVIVPVYNTEKYLNRCVDSVLSQTYTDFELLLVDDGSTDSSGTNCDSYALQDERVRVFHQVNGGVSSARKLGLDNAQGEWVTFIDSDDYVNDSFLFNISENITSKIDLVITSVSENKYLTREEYINEMLKRRLPPQIWGKLYRKCVLNDVLSLPRQLYWGEDLVANILVGINLRQKVYLKNISLYNYDINESSVSSKRQSSLEYEDYFVRLLQSKLGGNLIKYMDAFNFTKLYILEDLIVCKQTVDYGLPWIEELIEWGKTKSLTFRQKSVLSIRNNTLCRYILAIERKISRFCNINA